MYVRALIWWNIFRICLEERLVYRADFALGTLMRFLPIVTQIFLWRAIFSARGDGDLAGYTRDSIIAYYLLTMIGRAFSSMPGLSSGVARQIREGEIKKFLIQPVNLISFLLLSRIAHKSVYYSVAFLPFAFVFVLCRDYFNGWPPAGTICAFIASLIMGFLIGYFLELTIGMIGFWFLEVSSLLFVYMLFSFFLSGHMFPLDMLKSVPLGGGWTCFDLIQILPFQYLAYFPASVFLGKVQGAGLAWALCIEATWLIVFIVSAHVAFRRGVKRYSGYGG